MKRAEGTLCGELQVTAGLWSSVENLPYVIPLQPIILTLRRLMSYIYGAPIFDVSRSNTTTQHSR